MRESNVESNIKKKADFIAYKKYLMYLLVFVICFFTILMCNKCVQAYKSYTGEDDVFGRVLYSVNSAFSFGGPFGFSTEGMIISAFLLIVFAGVIVYFTADKKNLRSGEEYGAARKGDIYKEAFPLNAINNSEASKKDESANMILSENIQIDMDTWHTGLNNNIFVSGGSGTGKTRYFVKPNILQMYCNYIVIDPKGSVAKDTGKAFEQAGYNILYLNLVNMDKSMGYNPFAYFKEPEDIQDFVFNLIENTSDKNKTGGDEFFVKAETTWLTAIVFFIFATCQGTDICNFNTVLLLLSHSQALEENNDEFNSEVDLLFDDLEKEHKVKSEDDPMYVFEEMAISNYKFYRLAAGKTAKSILVSVATRLQPFLQPKFQNLLSKDELHLERIGEPMVISKEDGKQGVEFDVDRETYEKFSNERHTLPYEKLPKERLRKTILFIVISDYKGTFSFMASIILQQLYAQLYYTADERGDNRLPIHTRFINDEFANCGKQPDFNRKISTMRSREISTAVIVQGISQIKSNSLYGDDWEAIFENCDTTLFLGSKGPTTQKTMVELGGKETVTHITHSDSKGTSGSHTVGEQIIQRDLYDQGDIARLDNKRCLVHIRGHFMYEDNKYDVLNHKNIDLTADSPNAEKARKNNFGIVSYIEKMRKIEEERLDFRRKFIAAEQGTLQELERKEALQRGEFFGDLDLMENRDECFITQKELDVVEKDILVESGDWNFEDFLTSVGDESISSE